MAEKLREGQPELFDGGDEILRITAEDTKPFEEQVKAIGRKIGDRYSDQIFEIATKLLERKMREMNIDIEAEMAKHNWTDGTVADYIQESDDFYTVVSDLCGAFIDGMETNWPFPINV